MDSVSCLLGLDIGTKRIGIALARSDVLIASPLTTIDAAETERQVLELIQKHNVSLLVAGWPRGLLGQTTEQTKIVETIVAKLRLITDIPVELQDEALTSQKAEAELAGRRKPFTKGDIDALAATYILEDFIRERTELFSTDAANV